MLFIELYYEHLKFDLDRIQINKLKLGKWLKFVNCFQKTSKTVNTFFLKSLYYKDIRWIHQNTVQKLNVHV